MSFPVDRESYERPRSQRNNGRRNNSASCIAAKVRQQMTLCIQAEKKTALLALQRHLLVEDWEIIPRVGVQLQPAHDRRIYWMSECIERLSTKRACVPVELKSIANWTSERIDCSGHLESFAAQLFNNLVSGVQVEVQPRHRFWEWRACPGLRVLRVRHSREREDQDHVPETAITECQSSPPSTRLSFQEKTLRRGRRNTA